MLEKKLLKLPEKMLMEMHVLFNRKSYNKIWYAYAMMTNRCILSKLSNLSHLFDEVVDKDEELLSWFATFLGLAGLEIHVK